MTLFELLHKVSFDDLIPTLKDVYDVEADIYAYREAFDELSLLHPTGNNERELRRNRAKRMRDARMEASSQNGEGRGLHPETAEPQSGH